MDNSYSYVQLATDFGVSERTIYRWLEIMNAEYPEEKLVLTDGKKRYVTGEGYMRLSQISEEIRVGIREDVQTDSDVMPAPLAITTYLGGDELDAPDFDAPKQTLMTIIRGLQSKGEQLGEQLGEQATYFGLGKGLAKGQEKALKKLAEKVQL